MTVKVVRHSWCCRGHMGNFSSHLQISGCCCWKLSVVLIGTLQIACQLICIRTLLTMWWAVTWPHMTSRAVHFYVLTRPHFLNSDRSASKRTDETFRSALDADHHVGVSPLTQLFCGLVSDFALDYMQLVCLAVVRRLLHLWIHGPHCTRMSQSSGFNFRHPSGYAPSDALQF